MTKDDIAAADGWPTASELGAVIWKTQRAVERLADARLQADGLATSPVRVLRLVHQAPGLSVADLARRLGFAPQSVASLVEQAERDEHLERKPHPVHGRIRQLYLTDSGRQALRRAVRVLRQLERELTGDMGHAERDDLARRLRRIAERADQLPRSRH